MHMHMHMHMNMHMNIHLQVCNCVVHLCLLHIPAELPPSRNPYPDRDPPRQFTKFITHRPHTA